MHTTAVDVALEVSHDPAGMYEDDEAIAAGMHDEKGGRVMGHKNYISFDEDNRDDWPSVNDQVRLADGEGRVVREGTVTAVRNDGVIISTLGGEDTIHYDEMRFYVASRAGVAA